MATTFVDYTGDGNATKSFSFPSIKEADIKVEVDEVLKTSGNHYNITSYTTTGGGNVVFTSGNIPASPAAIRIFRDTDVDSAKATFTAGSSVKAGDLNNNNKQLLYSAQEEQNQTIQTHKIKDSAVTTAKIKDLAVTTAKLADDAVTAAKIAAKTITNAYIADDTITSALMANNAIDTPYISNNAVTTAKIAADNITNALIADSQIDSEHYVDGSIDREHLAADIVDSTKLADDAVGSEHIQQNSVTDSEIATGTLDNRYYTETELNAGQLDSRYFTETELSSGGAIDSRYYTETELDAGQLDNRYFTETELTGGALDGRYYTETEAEARFLRQDSTETIASGVTWSSNDSKVATTAAIDARIIDLVDDVGGFVPISNETNFPNANPDVNNGAGTLISVKTALSSHNPSSGTVTIANGNVGDSATVTITNVPSTIPQGFGFIVETTSTLHTYNFHRLVPKATEVTTVATNVTNIVAAGQNVSDINNFVDIYQISNNAPTARADSSSLNIGDLWFDSSSNKVMMVYDGSAGDGFSAITPNQATLTNINIVAGHVTFQEDLGNITDAINTGSGNNSVNTVGANINSVNTVANSTNLANITAVAADQADIGAVAAKATEIGRLGTADAVADLAILGTADVVADMNTLATADIVADMNLLATNDVVADMALLAVPAVITDMSMLATNDIIADMALLATTDCIADMAILGTADVVADMNMLAVSDVISDMNTLAVSSVLTNIGTVAASIGDVNRYANEYVIQSGTPSSPSTGDLWYNTGANVLNYYNGSTFVGISPGISGVINDANPALANHLDCNDKNLTEVGTVSGNNLQIDFGTI